MMKLLYEVKSVRYELFDMHALDEMAVMIVEAFTRYEPMVVTQNFSLEELVEFIKLRGPKATQEELTILARDQETGQVIGAMLTEDFALAPPEDIEHFIEKFGAILTLLDELDAQYKQGISLRVGEYLHLLMTSLTASSLSSASGAELNPIRIDWSKTVKIDPYAEMKKCYLEKDYQGVLDTAAMQLWFDHKDITALNYQGMALLQLGEYHGRWRLSRKPACMRQMMPPS